jgi:2-oxoglutarate ferredoxin oxidoreductase subunit alpha
MFDLTIRAFNLSERYRAPVILLADEITAHMREQILIPATDQIELVDRKTPEHDDQSFFGGQDVPPMPGVGEGYNVAVTGSTHNERGLRFTADAEVHRRLVTRLVNKVRKNAELLMAFETFNVETCDVGFISFGCTSRAVYDAVEMARKEGINAGFLRLKTIWPFPEKVVLTMARSAKAILVPEMNLQQVFFEVQRVVNGVTEVIPVNKVGGGEMLTPEELVSEIKTGVGA